MKLERNDSQHRQLGGVVLVLLLLLATVLMVAFDTRTYYAIALHIFAVPAIAYPAIYMKSPWRDGPTGRALMNKARAVAIFFALSVVSFWQPFQFDGYLFCLALTYLGWAIAFQFSVMLRLRRRALQSEEVR